MAQEETLHLEALMGTLQPTASGYVEASGGARLYYELYGSGTKVLVFLNGAYGKIPFAGHVTQRMVRLGYRVLLYEPRGIGRSTCRPGRQTTRLLARDCLAVVDAVLGPSSPFYLMGASMGGMVAQEVLHRLVVTRRQSRVLGAFLVATCLGNRWRPPPYRRASNVRRTVLPHLSYKDDADVEARFPIDMMFGREWLDSPSPAVAPGGRSAAQEGAGAQLQLEPQGAQALRQQEEHDASATVSCGKGECKQQQGLGKVEQPGQEGAQKVEPETQFQQEKDQELEQQRESVADDAEKKQTQRKQEQVQERKQEEDEGKKREEVPLLEKQQQPQPPQPPPLQQQQQQQQASGGVLTRKQRFRALLQSHWRQLAALHIDEMGGVLWHMTAHKSHFLGPRRAAAIRASGIRIGVGICTDDMVHPPEQQHRLAAQLGAEEYVVGSGHCDWGFFEGVSLLAAGALATFRDSRV